MSLPAAEVAADFRDALQDLKMNSRPEISNLTLIAKENTEYAQAISTELENHIKSTRPEFKLPALYVLDSIIKNVGTPYTVYLGRNMYRTFMDAYLVMEQNTRKAMEGLLRTWKLPVPESLDPRPVFPADVTRDIENALTKMRTAMQATQRPQHALPARPPTTVAWRDTATPPQNMPRYAAPNDPRVRPGYPPTPQYGPSMHGNGPPMHFQSPHQPEPPMTSLDLNDIKAELAQLISTTQSRFASNYNDVSIQKTLGALLQLKQILDTQTLPPQQLEAVRKQIQSLAPPPAPTPTFPQTYPIGYPPATYPPSTPTPGYPPQPAIPNYASNFPPVGGPPSSAPPNVAQLLANFRPPIHHTPQPQPAAAPPPITNLAELLRRVSTPQQSSSVPAPAPFQPPPFTFPPAMPTSVAAPPATVPAPSGTPTANLAALLAQFNKPAGAPPASLPPQPTPLPAYQPPQPLVAPPSLGTPDWLSKVLGGIQGMPTNGTPVNSQDMTPRNAAPTNIMDHIELTTASMKKPRFHLISRIYEAKPNICASCGRRFEATAEGKEKKARHMDWHFKVRDPDANKRGAHRSWYIGEKEWIDYTEVDETAPPHEATATASANKPKKQAKDRYISVPQDPALQHAPCSICQEKFQTQWNADANDFVWMDALQVGPKVYHATCYEEYSKNFDAPVPRTPDSVLGKRKAEMGGEVHEKKIRAF